MVISKKNRIRMFLLSTLMMFSMCFFFAPINVSACASECDDGLNAKMKTVICNDGLGAGVDVGQPSGTGDELPSEITEPIDKGMKLLEYLVITIGIVAIMVGLVLLGLSFWGHQNDLKIASFIALGAGLVILAAPSIAKWLAGR